MTLALLGSLFAVADVRASDRKAKDGTSAADQGATDADFRVRVANVLRIGKSKSGTARAELERALVDAHPAVRSAAAAALATLGDTRAIATLSRRLVSESSASVKAQLQASIDTLKVAEGKEQDEARWSTARVVVSLGPVRNLTKIKGGNVDEVFKAAAFEKAKSVPGVVVTDGDDGGRDRARQKHLPVVQLDGTLTKLDHDRTPGEMRVSAAVEFSVRRVPEQTLRGSLSGRATSIGSPKVALVPEHLAALQNQAIDGAVESALRGANRGLVAAVR